MKKTLAVLTALTLAFGASQAFAAHKHGHGATAKKAHKAKHAHKAKKHSAKQAPKAQLQG